MNTNDWYASLLSGDEASVYYEIFRGAKALSREIKVPKLDYKRISEIYELVRLDHPEIFYLAPPSFKAYSGASHVTVIPNYIFSDGKISETGKMLSSRVKRILRPAEELDDLKKLSFVSKWIFENTVYEKLEKQYSHEIYGVLSHGIGVCEGISKTVKYMLDHLGINSLVVVSEADEFNMRHAWNMIELYGKMRHYDLTFDLSRKEKGLKPVYSAMTDEMIFKDHRMPEFPIPEAKNK